MMIKLVVLLSLLRFSRYVSSAGVKNFLQFEFISSDYSTQAYTADNLETILENPNFDRRKRTTIYSYGFTQTISQPSVREIVDAYLMNGNFNFILVNYNSILAYTLFNANEFADIIAFSLIRLFDAGYNKFHLVGFSLGAQISGLIGRKVLAKSAQRHVIPRITGLDPGQIPSFLQGFIENLNANDAAFVDTIHGESNFFGSKESVGHASFWINGGISQPNCKSSFFLSAAICSHLMTPKYWAAAVRGIDLEMFSGVNCSSYDDFKNKHCENSSRAFMGLSTHEATRGRFYLDAELKHD